MVDVYKNKIFVGNQYELNSITNEFNVVHAAKEPFHRQLVRYYGKSCPKDKYYYEDECQASLCIIDFPSRSQWDYFPEPMLIKTMNFIDKSIQKGKKVFIHCNQGFSRGPSVAFMYLVSRDLIKKETLKDSLDSFIETYPMYAPKNAILENINRKYPFQYLRNDSGGQK